MGRADDAGTDKFDEAGAEAEEGTRGAATPVLLEFTTTWHSRSAPEVTMAVLLDRKSNSGAAGHAAE